MAASFWETDQKVTSKPFSKLGLFLITFFVCLGLGVVVYGGIALTHLAVGGGEYAEQYLEDLDTELGYNNDPRLDDLPVTHDSPEMEAAVSEKLTALSPDNEKAVSYLAKKIDAYFTTAGDVRAEDHGMTAEEMAQWLLSDLETEVVYSAQSTQDTYEIGITITSHNFEEALYEYLDEARMYLGSDEYQSKTPDERKAHLAEIFQTVLSEQETSESTQYVYAVKDQLSGEFEVSDESLMYASMIALGLSNY